MFGSQGLSLQQPGEVLLHVVRQPGTKSSLRRWRASSLILMASELVLGCLVVLSAVPLKHTKTKVLAGEFIWKTKRSTCFVWVSSCKWVPLETRIVGEMWPVQLHCEGHGLPMYEEAQQVHHVDGDRTNNSFGQPGAMWLSI